jgi:hypothetical protein
MGLSFISPGQTAQEPPRENNGPGKKARSPDVGKRLAESPAKAMVGESASLGAMANPHVAPGQVRWHRNFAAACAAARNSGKPVLLFHMMGKLDDQFC